MAVASGIDVHWRDDKSHTECLLYMLENENMCDVTFQVGNNKKQIKAHKLMLSSRSPVFHDMFKRSLPETEMIPIPNIDESNFKAFLRYIYSDELGITIDNVSEMFYLSDRYRIRRLKKECKKVLRKTAVTNNAAKSLQIAYEYKLDNILDESLSFFEKNTSQCLLSKYSLVLTKKCLELILKSENIGCKEDELCSFFLKWTENQCKLEKVETNGENMRKMAGDLLYLLRFSIVDHEILTKYFDTGLLTSGEQFSISQVQCGIGFESSIFPFGERKSLASRETICVKRFQGSDQFGWQSNGVEALQFETNKDIWLKGVAIGSLLYGNWRESLSCVICFKVLNAYHKEFYKCEKIVFSSMYTLTEVMFPEPVRISKLRKYTIKMEGLVFPSCYNLNCVNSVSVRDVTFTFEKSDLCKTGTDETRGQFAGLMFSL